ncbi:Type I methionyl aminopeptidase [[Mycoplasma] cavipharyngis]|uniref:type I methionyl aminopeptidase n=1 Tax=[Mycoplasma] cavipharyngis TaxID=92757 RepID=UPI0037047786
MIYLKNTDQINQIKAAAELWKEVIAVLKKMITVDHSPLDLSNTAEKMIRAAKGECAFKNYHGFPGNLCISVNEVAIHGIPSKKKFLATDKVGIDLGVKLNGYFCDAGFSQIVDPATNLDYQRLVDHTHQALLVGIAAAKAGNYTGDITAAISNYVATNCPEYHILDDFCGHGCGLKLHEDPFILNKGMTANTGVKLVPGMIICIEPILTDQKDGSYIIDPNDHWSVKVTNNHKVCHFEHMILILENETIILTK